ncbi:MULTISPECIES: cation diffusion facilitator family transporter [Bacteroidales]|jgi:Co/Zn/Cd efflux system component|uniref:Zinc transporter ZitB n=2 Tax=root TaxID=1 RepID=A0A644WCH8_9ZZZZ|nr:MULTISPECIES: cation diffusion facilitator family transporter [Bacteroidales]NDV67790.1 cation diffusion facilitator family transporter [Dysgonomonas sp. 25]OJV82668.1 MAG: cation transporter [Bacteroidia bacterium 44-10]MCL3851033.1 cation transporter [Parabacteroides leei]MDC2615382.1 cation transporter [Bacteroides ovatus]MDC2634656.1 cation transporter [Bacteroides ovatus]
MNKSIFKIEQMDCPSEENLIRMKLQNIEGVAKQEFDLKGRIFTVYHTGDYQEIEKQLATLNLGSRFIESKEVTGEVQAEENSKQRKVLWIVLAINFGFFLIEMSTGIISKSMGLVADSLDMLADAFVYGLSLFAVGAAVSRKKRVAMICGYFQILLAAVGFIEVIRRFTGTEEMPVFQTMIGISVLALIANVICLLLLQRTKSKDAHIQASIIFSSNDVIINAGVILAGFLVWQLNNQIPDLIIGSIVFLIVIRGAIRILKLAKN